MAIILATRGQQILVDDEDFKQLNQSAWYICCGYAIRFVPVGHLTHKEARYKMQRQVMGLPLLAEDGLWVYHINRNKLDNRKHNLRVCTKEDLWREDNIMI